MSEEKLRILYCMPETNGDVLISTGVIDGIKKKFPNSTIYFATQEKYFEILEENPNIAAVIPYEENMLNYRAYEIWGFQKNLFDIVYCPFIVTQRIPHWIHGGHGEWLGRVYADMCNVEYGEQWMRIDEDGVPEFEYITVHSQTRTDPKDFDNMQKVIDKIKNIKKVQIGGPEDKKLDGIDLDLRGKTTPAELAGILKHSKLHIGLDSFPMHVAALVDTPSVVMFGGTYAKQGVNPAKSHLITPIETRNRGPCVTSCHLLECEAKKAGFDKCINNIPLEEILTHIEDKLGSEYVEGLDPITLSAYLIIKDGIKYEFPFEKCIEKAAAICDEVVVVDGGSTDGTWEKLQTLGIEKLSLFEHKWDMNNPTLFGDEKAYARSKCTSTHLIQLDADEILSEPNPGSIRELIKYNRYVDVLDLPTINFYGDDQHIRLDPNCWKWRISKNDPNITHGVHAAARELDPETLTVTMDKGKSDGCEYIYEDSLDICEHRIAFPPQLIMLHEQAKKGENQKEYVEVLKEVADNYPVIFHYSWMDLDRKKNNSDFWQKTWHGQREATHNTAKDIEERIKKGKEIVIEVGETFKENLC